MLTIYLYMFPKIDHLFVDEYARIIHGLETVNEQILINNNIEIKFNHFIKQNECSFKFILPCSGYLSDAEMEGFKLLLEHFNKVKKDYDDKCKWKVFVDAIEMEYDDVSGWKYPDTI